MRGYLPIELSRSVRRAERREAAQQKVIGWMPAILDISDEVFYPLFSQLDQGDKDRMVSDVALCVYLHHTESQPPNNDFLRNIIGGVDLMQNWKEHFLSLGT